MKKALITGKFNVLHAGHIRLFRFAKEHADHLTVAILPDSDCHGNYVSEELRLDGLKNNALIDNSLILRESVADYISNFKPDFVIKGLEYESLINEEKPLLESYGGKLLFCSSELIYANQKADDFVHEQLLLNLPPKEYLDRHQINQDSLRSILSSFVKLNVLVIGDVIVDEYIFCKPMGMSREDSSIVSMPIKSQKFLGGAGIVAAHARSLGARCTLLTVCGIDNNKIYVENQLSQQKVGHHLIVDSSRPTTHKIRYKNHDATLFRLSHFHESKISNDIAESFLSYIRQNISSFDLIIFSDFNYGVITPEIRLEVASLAKAHNIFLAADSQSSSQFGDISSYKDCDLIFATEYEARLSLFDKDSGLISLINRLQKKSNSTNLILKLGQDGILIRKGSLGAKQTFNSEHIYDDQLPALNDTPNDISGAGDSMLITTSMAMAINGNIWSASLLGSIAAAIQVSRIGNIPLKREDFFRHTKK